MSEATARLERLPYEDLGYARVDHHRDLRCGFPEVTFGQGKTVEHFLGTHRAHALGWDRPSQPVSQAGQYFRDAAVGHLGFTGCSLWIELEQEIIAILLSNRVHPSRSNERIQQFRPQINDALFEYYLYS